MQIVVTLYYLGEIEKLSAQSLETQVCLRMLLTSD